MGKSHFFFGATFFILAISGTLLLTWTAWWIAVVGPSVPARRPFFRPASEVPELIQQASNVADEEVFQYALAGGWPRVNYAVRLIAALLAVFCSFTFAFAASLLPVRSARLMFSFCLLLTALAALVAAVLDGLSLGKTASECADRMCVTAVPEAILESGNTCRCNVDGWFYFTLGVDIVLLISALVCLALTFRPILERRTSNLSLR